MKKNKKFFFAIEAFFLFLAAVSFSVFSGCSDSVTNSPVTTASKYQALTEAEFNANSSLRAIPGAVVYDDLEHLNTPSSLLGDDTGPIGEDVIAYTYIESATHRFKLGADARFKVRLVNESGAVIYQLNNPGDTARVSIPAGNYKLYLTSLVNYGSDSMGIQPVFIQPDLDAIASGGVLPQVGYSKEDLNTLLTTNKCIKCNLEKVKINNKNLSGADLSYADLSQSELTNVNFSNAKFTHTVWFNSGAFDCIFKGANFTSTILNRTTFRRADFKYAVFQRLNTTPTFFESSDLRYVTFDSGACYGIMDGCDLSYSTFSNLSLRDLSMDDVKLIGATFSNVYAYKVSLVNSNSDSAKFINNTLFSINNLRGSTLRYATFTNFRGDGSGFDDCIMTGSRITNSGFNGGSLRAAILINTVWNNIDINAVNMCHQDRTGASFTSMRYNGDTDCWP